MGGGFNTVRSYPLEFFNSWRPRHSFTVIISTYIFLNFAENNYMKTGRLRVSENSHGSPRIY